MSAEVQRFEIPDEKQTPSYEPALQGCQQLKDSDDRHRRGLRLGSPGSAAVEKPREAHETGLRYITRQTFGLTPRRISSSADQLRKHEEGDTLMRCNAVQDIEQEANPAESAEVVDGQPAVEGICKPSMRKK